MREPKRAAGEVRDREINREFDGEGVRRALLAALRCIYNNSPYITLPQFLVALEVLVAEVDGNPHTLASLVRQLKMPFSTASRVIWSLTKEGGDLGLVRYERHPTDRRKKYLVMDPDNLNTAMPRAITQAMMDYYGESLKNLRRAPKDSDAPSGGAPTSRGRSRGRAYG
jgi:DNA-binding MarR family transcriptional regulator